MKTLQQKIEHATSHAEEARGAELVGLKAKFSTATAKIPDFEAAYAALKIVPIPEIAPEVASDRVARFNHKPAFEIEERRAELLAAITAAHRAHLGQVHKLGNLIEIADSAARIGSAG